MPCVAATPDGKVGTLLVSKMLHECMLILFVFFYSLFSSVCTVLPLSQLVHPDKYNNMNCNLGLRDWSLITGRGVQNGKIAGPKLSWAPPLKTG